MVKVGTAKICFSRMSRMVSSLSWLAWSMETTPALRRIECAGFTSGMNRNSLAAAGGFFDGGFEFGFRVLVNGGEAAIANHVRAGLVNFDEIGALFELLANRSHQFGGIVGIGRVRKHVLRGVVMIGILVSAENVDGISADAQTRSRKQALIDGVAHRCVGGTRAFGAHVALRGEAAIRSARAARVARIVRCGTDSSTVCKSSAPGCRNRCT